MNKAPEVRLNQVTPIHFEKAESKDSLGLLLGRLPNYCVRNALPDFDVLALNTAHVLRLNKADVLALNKAHVLRLNNPDPPKALPGPP